MTNSAISLSAKIKELGRHFIIYGFSSAAQSALSIIFIPLFTSEFSVSEYGIFSLLTIIGTVAGSIFYLGINSALPRSYFDYSEENDRKRCFSTSFFLLLLGTSLQIVLGFFAKESLSSLLFGSEEHAPLVWASLISSSALIMCTFFYTYLRLNRKSIQVLLITLCSLGLGLIIVYYAVAILQLGVAGAIWGQMISQIILFLVMLVVIAPGTLTWNIIKAEIFLQLRFGLGSVLASFAGMIIIWSGQFFINHYANLSEVGIYSLAAKLASIVVVIFVSPFMQIWTPMMMEYRKHDNHQAMFTNIIFIYCCTGVLLILCAAMFTDDLMYLLVGQEDYRKSVIIIPFLVFGVISYGLINFSSAGLLFERRILELSKIYYFIAAIYLLMSFLLVPQFGIWGALLSNMIISFTAPMLIYAASRKYYIINFQILKILKVVTIAIIVGSIDKLIIIESLLVRLTFQSTLILMFITGVYLIILSTSERQKLNYMLNKTKTRSGI